MLNSCLPGQGLIQSLWGQLTLFPFLSHHLLPLYPQPCFVNPQLSSLPTLLPLYIFCLLMRQVSKYILKYTQTVKNLPAKQETLAWGDTLKEGMVTSSSILSWRTPWTEEPDGLQRTGLQPDTTE